MHNFDRPLFKKLAHNDTGAAAGHQSGVVIPKAIDKYFPQLSAAANASNPAVSCDLRAALFIGTKHEGVVKTRYQYQTWSGTRPPERRITGQLGPLLNAASADDILLIERSLSDEFFYRLTLHKAGTSANSSYSQQIGSRRWGAVDPADTPVPEVDVLTAEQIQSVHEQQPFNLFDNAAALHETRVSRIARSKAFKRILLPLYDFRCAVCGLGHRDAGNRFEVEAAHIVPRGLKGPDDSRNGLVLCRSHHWAFDHGLFSIDPNRKVVLSHTVGTEPRNSHLGKYSGQLVRSPRNAALQPALIALDWHLKNILA
jgi:putative restriction endonuclease